MPSRVDRVANNDPRVTIRNGAELSSAGDCVVYWMQRSQRSNDNAALNLAIKAANALEKPVVVYFSLRADAHNANHRHYQFMLPGIADIASGLRQRGVGLVINRHTEQGILKFCHQVNPCLVISDENPLRTAEHGRMRVARELAVPFWTVDADVIVPTRLLGKEHYAARTIRPKIHALLRQFLKPLANPSARRPWITPRGVETLDPASLTLDNLPIDRSVGPVASFAGGQSQANLALRRFLRNRLTGYASNRNHPNIDGTSQLSPYLHFGHIGPHAVACAVSEAEAPDIDRKAFLEEFIVRRELAINFVRFNPRTTASTRASRGRIGRCAFMRTIAAKTSTRKSNWRMPKLTIRCGTQRRSKWC